MKRVGSCLYVHSSAYTDLKDHVSRQVFERIEHYLRGPSPLPDYIKYDSRRCTISLAWCRGWQRLPEPVVELTVTWNVDNLFWSKRYVHNPPIIHGKHLFMGEKDRNTKWWKKAEARWNSYQGQPWLDKSRMGFRDWWKKNALPRLSKG